MPVSVVVPHLPEREAFFMSRCLPSIAENKPEEIFVVEDSGRRGAPWARNDGARRATREFIFFCDDDVVLEKGAFRKLIDALDLVPEAGYSYCDFSGVSIPPHVHPNGPTFTHVARPFDRKALHRGNYISTMSLIRRAVFPGFDESLPRLQDWDLWLALSEQGIYGTYVPELLFTQFFVEGSISTGPIPPEVTSRIRIKHRL